MKTFFVLYLSISTSALLASNIVSGHLYDDQNQPLAWANVVMYQSSQKEPLKVSATDENGFFLLEDITNGKYYLEISYLGYKTITSDTFLVEGDLKNLEFGMTPDDAVSLSEVVIKSSRPRITQTAEKLIVDIEHSPQVNSNILDVVKKVPGLMVVNGQVRYAGVSGITIFINGKPTNYLDIATLLREMPADNIARVELIQQPGAEFDADGQGPILNIVLKKNVKLGTQGNIKASIGNDDDWEYRTSAFLSSYQNKINYQLSAGYSSNTWREDLRLTRQVNEDIYDQFNSMPSRPKSSTFSGRIDWYQSDRHSFGLSSQYTDNRNDYTSNILTSIISPSGVTSDLYTNDINDTEWQLFILNPYYEYHSLDKKHKLVLDYNFVNRASLSQNDLQQVRQSEIEYQDQRNIQDGEYDIHTYKLDYTLKSTDQLSLFTGFKFDQTRSDNNLMAFERNEDGLYANLMSRSNHFLIDEDILAVYAKVNYSLENWSLSAGLRWEESHTKGTSLTLDSTQNRDISKLFPSFSIQRKLNEHLAANFSYSYRISRPSYSTLNPFVTFYDPYTLDAGNPRLQPSFTNSYRFNLSFDNQPFFNLEYKQTKDAIFEIITQNDQTSVAARQQINLENQNSLSGYIGAPLDLAWDKLSGHVAVGLNYVENKSTNIEVPLDDSRWSWFVSSNMYFNLPWEMKGELYAGYTNGGLDGLIDYSGLAWMGVSISKNLFNERLKVSASIDDMMTTKFNGHVNYANVDMAVISDWPRYNYGIQLAYNFGSKYKNANKNRTKASQDLLDRIN